MPETDVLNHFNFQLIATACPRSDVNRKLCAGSFNNHPYHASIGISTLGQVVDLKLPDPVKRRRLEITCADADNIMGQERAALKRAMIDCWEHVARYQAEKGPTKVLTSCMGGISRSVAMAIFLECAAKSDVEPQRILDRMMGRIGNAPGPNMAIITLADEMLERNGALIKAVEDHPRFKAKLTAHGWFGNDRDEVVAETPSGFLRAMKKNLAYQCTGGD